MARTQFTGYSDFDNEALMGNEEVRFMGTSKNKLVIKVSVMVGFNRVNSTALSCLQNIPFTPLPTLPIIK